MSFTEDELQSFNTILEQRLTAHRQEMEQVLEQRIHEFRRATEQRIVATQQEIVGSVVQKLSEYQSRVESVLGEKVGAQQAAITQALGQDVEQRQHQFETSVDRMLAAQLLGIEQLLSQHLSLQVMDEAALTPDTAQLEAIEVQTELHWEDLMDVIGKVLDERLVALNDSTQRALKNLEQYLSVRLHSLRDEFVRGQVQSPSYNGNATTVEEVLHGIEHLERIIESMQVAMTANNALLSNRLYHHQQLPLERAHPGNHTHIASNKSAHNPLSLAKERVASGMEPETLNTQAAVEELKGE